MSVFQKDNSAKICRKFLLKHCKLNFSIFIGVDRDAICEKYKQLSTRLSASKSSEDKRVS